MDKEKFLEKIRELTEIGKAKKNTLEYKEIVDHFADAEISEAQMEKVMNYLEAHGIDVLRVPKDDSDDSDESVLLLKDDDPALEEEEVEAKPHQRHDQPAAPGGEVHQLYRLLRVHGC